LRAKALGRDYAVRNIGADVPSGRSDTAPCRGPRFSLIAIAMRHSLWAFTVGHSPCGMPLASSQNCFQEPHHSLDLSWGDELECSGRPHAPTRGSVSETAQAPSVRYSLFAYTNGVRLQRGRSRIDKTLSCVRWDHQKGKVGSAETAQRSPGNQFYAVSSRIA
jgi:hypothetical protein